MILLVTVSYEKYAALRDMKNLNDHMVAKQANVPKQCISDWKLGKTELSLQNVIRIADLFEIKIEDILERKEESND